MVNNCSKCGQSCPVSGGLRWNRWPKETVSTAQSCPFSASWMPHPLYQDRYMAPEDDMWSCPLAYTHKNTYIHTNTQNNVTPKETLPLLLVLVAGMKSSHRLVNINVQSWYYTVQGFHWNLQGLKKPKRLRRNTPKPLWTCQDEQRSLLHKPCKWLNPSLENNVRLSLFPKDWGKGLEIWPLGTVPSLRAWRHGFATLATMEK
jgi:hypothetical protein